MDETPSQNQLAGSGSPAGVANRQNLEEPNQRLQYSIPGILHFIQHEWARFEMERSQWELERAELQVCFVAFIIPCGPCFPPISLAGASTRRVRSGRWVCGWRRRAGGGEIRMQRGQGVSLIDGDQLLSSCHTLSSLTSLPLPHLPASPSHIHTPLA